MKAMELITEFQAECKEERQGWMDFLRESAPSLSEKALLFQEVE